MKKKGLLFFFTMCLASLCWLFTFFEAISNHFNLVTLEAIPAFQAYTITLSD